MDSDELKLSCDEDFDLNVSISSSEFSKEIKDKVTKHYRQYSSRTKSAKYDSESDSDLEDIDLKTAFEYYDILTPT